MKFIIVFVALFSLALAAPAAKPQEAQVLYYNSDVQPDGYKFAVATSDGTSHNEQGQLINIGAEDEAISVSGTYSFVADDGQTYTVSYIADENGFQPHGDHLPKKADA